MKCIFVNGSDMYCYIDTRKALEENAENSLIGLEMIADGVEKVGVVGKYGLDSNQRIKKKISQITGEWRKTTN